MTEFDPIFEGSIDELSALLQRLESESTDFPWELARMSASNRAVAIIKSGLEREKAILLARISLLCGDRFVNSDEYSRIQRASSGPLSHMNLDWRLHTELNLRAYLLDGLGEVDGDLGWGTLLRRLEKGITSVDTQNARDALDRPFLERTREELARQRFVKNLLRAVSIVLDDAPYLPERTNWWWARFDELP